ncbi:MAG: ATP-dependent zinc metalloprotease FtsH [candidate division WWE3 bacterium GW2011_GWB2_43_22]|uniref:ATP-dependent zinc metalloprotease FtsH n=1 Tax=candidate division WWE3 bacterium GW2011_GWB2_43_22 TaxID=1619118 RepID=A0A0G1ERC6_UNCKA|nr:MAG: ATP-dependent zinc metalloprotease FtsH [candidate division WWE3 bacterium GW2011_GWB2_43_22]
MANKNGNNKNGKKAKNKQVSIPFVGNISPRSPWGNVFFYLFLIFLFFMIFGGSGGLSPKPEQVGVNELVKLIKSEKVQDVVVAGDKLEVQLKDGTKLLVEKEGSISFDQILTNNEVDRSKIAGDVKVERRVTFEQILTPVLMFGFPLVILFFIFRQMRNANSDIASFGKSRARLFKKGQTQITFNDVAGNEEAKTEMMEIVDFLKNPEKYRKLGARIPKGILLVGPSGVGKTLLAKAIAGEANVPFYSVAGSEFMEMLVGVGSSRVRDLFDVARNNQPSLIFVDEIDAIGRQRGMGIGGGHDEREQTLNQILIEMDGFDTRTDVIVLAATNRPDMLDPALIRPGRFDRTITVMLPDLKDREAIIKIHMREKPIAEDVKIEQMARKTVGFSGADIENMMNEAAILAARAGKTKIEQVDIEEAALKVTLGSERKTLQTEEERKMTAYHEAGHALVSAFVKDMDPVYRVSIIARGASLGHTSFPPERDRYNETKTRLSSIISTMLGGRAAEEIVFGELTVGASDDIGKATGIARKMVAEWGMSSLGPVSYDIGGGQFWLARGIEEGNKVSEEMAAKIDAEVEKLIHSAYTHAKEIIEANKEKLDKVAAKLLEKETIDGEEFRALVA